MSKPDLSVGFITALVSDELENCEKSLENGGWQLITGQLAHRFNILAINVWQKHISGATVTAYTSSIGRMGQAASAVETTTFLNRTKPSCLFLTGIAGSLKSNDVHLGDVIVSREVLWRSQNKISDPTDPNTCDEYRPYMQPVSTPDPDVNKIVEKFLLSKYQKTNRSPDYNGDFNVHFSGLYTWDYVLSNKRIVQSLNNQFPSYSAVEMEAGGFLESVSRYQKTAGKLIPAYIVKGISDYAEKKVKVPEIRTAASFNSANVAVSLAEHFFSESINRKLLDIKKNR